MNALVAILIPFTLTGIVKNTMAVREDLSGYSEIPFPCRMGRGESNILIMKKYTSNSPDETKDIGFSLGKLLKKGDIVGLYGELGAGKTTMAKGIARAFGIDEKDIVSASFTIIAEYDSTPPFNHIDLYRIENEAELTELGLWDTIGGNSVSVIEWAERTGAGFQREMIRVTLKSVHENMREIEVEGINEKNRDNM
jgi:tRNA threonylcarbamoyladenosine biosynthesis protein TsaE